MNKLKFAICAAAMAASIAHAEMSFRGFGSVVVGQTVGDDDDMMPLGYDENLNLKRDSLFALQAESDMGDGLSATVQFVAKGKADFNPVVEWAYITYEFNDSWKINAGRLRAPFYRYSDFLDVRYALNWVAAPERLYNFDFPGYDGINLIYNSSIGKLDSNFQFIYGELNGNINPNEPDESEALLENSFGLVWNGSASIFNFRASYYQAKATIGNQNAEQFSEGLTGLAGNFSDPATLGLLNGAVGGLTQLSQTPMIPAELAGALEQAATAGQTALDYSALVASSILDSADNGRLYEDDSTFVSLGLGFEKGPFLFDSEWINYSASESLLQDVEALAVTLGWRFDNYLIYVTGATEERKVPTDALNALASKEEFKRRVDAFNAIAAPLLAPDSLIVSDMSPLPEQFTDPAVQALGGLQAGLSALSAGYTEVYDGVTATLEGSTIKLQNTTIGLRYDIHPAATLKFAYEIAKDKTADTDADVARISLDFVF